MRKLLTFVVVIAISLGATAQTMKVQSAYSDMKNRRLGYAVKNIEAAMEHEDTKKDPKTWHYGGLIYASLLDAALDEDNQRFFRRQKVTLTNEEIAYKATESLVKSIELERENKQNEYIQTNQITLNNVLIHQLDFALEVFNEQKFQEAIPLLQNIVDAGQVAGVSARAVSQKANYCIALSYDYLKDRDNAAAIYRDLVRANTDEELVYINLYTYNLQNEELDKGINVLKRGIRNLPNSFRIKALLSGAYQQNDQAEEAEKLIEELIEMAEKTENTEVKNTIFVLAGDSRRDAGRLDEAKELYEKALALTPENLQANFSIGVMYFNHAIDKLGEANEVPHTDRTGKYEKLLEESLASFKSAIPSFNKVLAENPNHYNTLNALRTIYSRLEMTEEYQEVSAKIDELIKASQQGGN